MRRPIIIVLIAIAAIVVAVILAASLLNVNKFRPRIQAELQTRLGRPVTLGELHLRLMPLSIRVDGLTIGQPAGWPAQRPFATAKEVYVSAGLFSLLRGQPHIKDLSLDQPEIELIKSPQGVWNFSNIGNGGGNQSGQAKSTGNRPGQGTGSPAQTSQQQQSELALNQLNITDGQVAVTDEQAKTPRAVYNHIDLKVNGFSSDKPFDFDLAAHFPGAGKELLAFNGTAGPLGAGNTQIIPVTGRLSLQEISVAGINSVASGTIPPNTNGVLSGSGDVNSQNENENVASKGNFKVENAVIHGAKLGYPIDAQYDLTMNRKTDQIQIHSGSVKLGPTAISISGGINSASKPSTLNLRVNTANASISDLSRLASAFSGSSGTADQVKGSVSADLAITGTFNAPQIQGNLSSSSLQAQGLVLSNVRAKCNTNNGVVTLSPVTAGIFGGQANGTIAVDTRPATSLCSVKTNLSGVDTNALLSAVSSLKNTLYGSLATDANLSFGLADDISKTLNGVVNFNVTNGQLKNINILKELSRVGKFLNPASSAAGNDTALKKFSGTLNIKNGLATTNNLVAVLNEGSLSANGSLNLVNQALDLHMNAVLAKGISSAVGGNGIGGFLNTALANNQGELVLPVLVTGTTAHPVFAPDVEAIAKMKLNHLLPTSGDPSKMTNGLAGSVLNGVLGQQSGQQKNQKQQSPLNSLFQQLNKKKH